MIKKPDRLVSRAEAERLKQTWYFTGKPCSRGHVSTRSLHSMACHQCRRKMRAPMVDPLEAERARQKVFHEQWMAEFKERRARERANRKLKLDLLS